MVREGGVPQLHPRHPTPRETTKKQGGGGSGGGGGGGGGGGFLEERRRRASRPTLSTSPWYRRAARPYSRRLSSTLPLPCPPVFAAFTAFAAFAAFAVFVPPSLPPPGVAYATSASPVGYTAAWRRSRAAAAACSGSPPAPGLLPGGAPMPLPPLSRTAHRTGLVPVAQPVTCAARTTNDGSAAASFVLLVVTTAHAAAAAAAATATATASFARQP